MLPHEHSEYPSAGEVIAYVAVLAVATWAVTVGLICLLDWAVGV